MTNYTELKDTIARWLHRSDLTEVIPDFIAMAEARFNREIRTTKMHATYHEALLDGQVGLPTDFLGFVELRCNGTTLAPRPLEWIRDQAVQQTGTATYFCVSGNNVFAWPADGELDGTYYKRIPALATATDGINWLLTAAPELYLYAALQESGVYTQDMESAAMWGARVPLLIEKVNAADSVERLAGGPLTIRVNKRLN